MMVSAEVDAAYPTEALVDLGELSLSGYRFAAHTARMYRFTSDDDEERPGWGFFIAGRLFEEPPACEDECGIFPDGAALYADDEPIPLPEVEDFTGLDFYLEEPYHPEHGEVYFTFNAWEARDVSEVRIRFVERQGARYRVELSALVHQVFAEPTELRYSGWVQVADGQAEDG